MSTFANLPSLVLSKIIPLVTSKFFEFILSISPMISPNEILLNSKLLPYTSSGSSPTPPVLPEPLGLPVPIFSFSSSSFLTIASRALVSSSLPVFTAAIRFVIAVVALANSADIPLCAEPTFSISFFNKPRASTMALN